MSNTNHTPGPWKLHSFSDGWIVNQQDGPGFIETVYKRSHGEEECEANARLISAAPELLQALEALLFVAKAELADPEDCGCIHAAEAAISKARGEA